MLIKEIALGLGSNLSSKAIQAEKKRYQGIIGSLMFSIVETKPDIAFSIAVIIYFTKNLNHLYFKTIKNILQYLKESINYEIIYGREIKLIIKGYLDSDYVGNKKSYKSTLDFISLLNDSPISLYLTRQSLVILSSIEAKYIVFHTRSNRSNLAPTSSNKT